MEKRSFVTVGVCIQCIVSLGDIIAVLIFAGNRGGCDERFIISNIGKHGFDSLRRFSFLEHSNR